MGGDNIKGGKKVGGGQGGGSRPGCNWCRAPSSEELTPSRAADMELSPVFALHKGRHWKEFGTPPSSPPFRQEKRMRETVSIKARVSSMVIKENKMPINWGIVKQTSLFV